MTARRQLLTADLATLLHADAGIVTADVARRQITGRILPYGTRATTSAGPTVFAAGACQPGTPEHVALLVEHDRNRSVGYATRIDTASDGLVATFTVPPGPAGDQALADAAAGIRTGLSVGVEVTASSPGPDGVLTVTAAALREVSLVSVPAWADARVVSVAAAAGIPAQTVGQPAGAGASTPPAPAGMGAAPAPAAAPQLPPIVPATVPQWTTAARPSLTVAAVSQLVAAVHNGTRDPADLRAALVDVIPANDAGAGLLRPAWIGELWSATQANRPIIDAIGAQPLPATGVKVQGWKWVAKPGGATYAGNKTAIPSQAVSTVGVEVPLTRWAGGNDVDRIYLDRGDAGFTESYFRMMAADYALDSETAVAGELHADATAGPAVATVIDALIDATGRLAAIGATVSFVAVAGDLFAGLFAITTQDAPWLMSQQDLLSRMFVAPALPAGELVIGDRRAATFYEDRPPIRVNAVNVAQGGVDLALFAYYATLVNDSRALLKYTPTAVVGTASSSSGRK